MPLIDFSNHSATEQHRKYLNEYVRDVFLTCVFPPSIMRLVVRFPSAFFSPIIVIDVTKKFRRCQHLHEQTSANTHNNRVCAECRVIEKVNNIDLI